MRRTAEEVVAGILGEPSLRSQADEILSLARERNELVQNASLIMAERERAQKALAAARLRFTDSLDMIDFEHCVTAQLRAMAIEEIAPYSFRSLNSAAPDSAAERIWNARYPQRHKIAQEFITALADRLKSELEKSEADDARLASSVGLEASDSASTKELRRRMKIVQGKNPTSLLDAARIIEEFSS